MTEDNTAETEEILTNTPCWSVQQPDVPKFRNCMMVKNQSKWSMSMRTEKELLLQTLRKPQVIRGYGKQPTERQKRLDL